MKLGRLGLCSSVLWLHAVGRIWSVFAIRLYDSAESLQLTRYIACKVLKLFLPEQSKLVKELFQK